jgi:surface antigen
MTRIRAVLIAALLTSLVVPFATTAASADTGTDLHNAQAKLTELDGQLEHAQGQVDMLNKKLEADKKQQAVLDKELADLARLQYQRPMFSISTVLAAHSLDQLMADVSQSRLVARKQQDLLKQSRLLQDSDQKARDAQQKSLNDVKAARDQAAQIAARALAANNASLAQAAQSLVTPAPWSGQGPFPNHFAYGYCTWYVANQVYVPWMGNAIEWWPNARAMGYAEGSAPRVHSIMVTRESSVGHVAWVESVDGSTIVVSEMNFSGWNRVDRRTINLNSFGPLVGFIYV